MGMNSAMTSLGRVVGPLWGGYIYDINIEYPFFSGAATLLLGWLVTLYALSPPTGANTEACGRINFKEKCRYHRFFRSPASFS
jgi:hypothetical protein